MSTSSVSSTTSAGVTVHGIYHDNQFNGCVR